MKWNKTELIAFVLLWLAIFVFACREAMSVCYGATPKADVLTFSWSTDGKTFTVTPSLPAKLRITTNESSACKGLAAVVSNGLPDLLDLSGAITITGNPSPQPGPQPQPNPGPTPNPTPTPGPLYVLVVYESADLVKMPISQVSILTSKPVRDYLGTHCAKDSKGTPEFRFLDKDANVSKLEPNLQKWFAEGAAKMKVAGKPWLAATNGRDVLNKELPATPDAFLETLKPLGGK